MRFAVILIAASALTACNVQAKHDDGKGDGKETVNISGGTDNVSFDLPFMKGQVKLPEGAVHGGNFDIDGVKMYPGANITGFNVFAKDKGADVNIAFNAPAPPEKVRAYFLEEFKKKGVEATASGDAVSGKAKDGDPFEIHVQAHGGGSQGMVKLHSNDDDDD